MRVCQIGCGNIGRKRIEALRRISDARIIKIYDADPETLNQVSKRYELDKASSVDEVFAARPDAIFLSVPYPMTYGIAREIVNRGISVSVEKPFCRTLAESERLTSLAEQKGVVLKTGFDISLDDGVRQAVEISRQEIGKIYHIIIRLCWGNDITEGVKGHWKSQVDGHNSFRDGAPHLFSILNQFIPIQEITEFQAVTTNIENDFWDNNYFVNGKYEDTIFFLHLGLKWKNTFELEVLGSDGYINLTHLPRWGEQTLVWGKRKFPYGVPEEQVFTFSENKSFQNDCEEFIRCVREHDFKKHLYLGHYCNLATERVLGKLYPF